MTSIQRRAWSAIIDRDQGLCICGKPANQIHHIIARSHCSTRRGGPDWLWQERNLISLCPACHSSAHNYEARVSHLAHLAETWGYKYIGAPWQEYLSAEPVLIAA